MHASSCELDSSSRQRMRTDVYYVQYSDSSWWNQYFHLWPNPPPATDIGRTVCTLLYLPVQAVPLFSLFRTEEPAKSSTCARDRCALQQLALNVHVKHSDLTWQNQNCLSPQYVYQDTEQPTNLFGKYNLYIIIY